MHAGRSMESPEDGAAAVQPLTGEWLTPSAALNRFVPTADARVGTDEGVKQTVRYGFRAASIGLLLAQSAGAELVAQGAVAPIPNGPAWLLGLMNLRGNLVPIADLQIALGVSSDEAASPRRETVPLVLVFGKGERAIGVQIEAAPQALKNLSVVSQIPPLPERLVAHAGDGYTEDQRFWVEFRHESFFEALVAEATGA